MGKQERRSKLLALPRLTSYPSSFVRPLVNGHFVLHLGMAGNRVQPKLAHCCPNRFKFLSVLLWSERPDILQYPLLFVARPWARRAAA